MTPPGAKGYRYRVGTRIEGILEVPEEIGTADRMTLRLTCRRSETSRDGEWTEWVPQWTDEREVPAGAWSRVRDGWRVPLSFDVPEGLPATEGSRFSWLLGVIAAPSGPKYEESFTLFILAADAGGGGPASIEDLERTRTISTPDA